MGLERNRLLPLAGLAAVVDEIDLSVDELYVDGPRDGWSPASLAAIVLLDPYEEEPELVVVDGVELHRALAGFQVVEVARNLGSIESVTPERFVAAIRHFHEFDGFLP